MHGVWIVAGGHRKAHGRRLVHGATWEVRRVGRARWLKTWGFKMEQRWVDYWEKKTVKNDENNENEVGEMLNVLNQSW